MIYDNASRTVSGTEKNTSTHRKAQIKRH